MATQTIQVPQEFIQSMQKFTDGMKDLLDKFSKIQVQAVQAQVQTPVTPQSPAHAQNLFAGIFRRMDQMFGKLHNVLITNTERLLLHLPTGFRRVLSSI